MAAVLPGAAGRGAGGERRVVSGSARVRGRVGAGASAGRTALCRGRWGESGLLGSPVSVLLPGALGRLSPRFTSSGAGRRHPTPWWRCRPGATRREEEGFLRGCPRAVLRGAPRGPGAAQGRPRGSGSGLGPGGGCGAAGEPVFLLPGERRLSRV